MYNKKYIVFGDTHGRFDHINTLINKKRPTMLIGTGDTGIWPRSTEDDNDVPVMYGSNSCVKTRKIHTLDDLKLQKTVVRFCPGNHEDWDYLDSLEDPEIIPNFFYMKRGSITTLPDGRNVLWMGGADSIDKGARTPGWDWFPQEIISQREFYELPDMRIDIVISHTCPTAFLPEIAPVNPSKVNDPCCKALQLIMERYRPDLWYFSHWHHFREGFTQGCRWTCLNMSPRSGWWSYLLD